MKTVLTIVVAAALLFAGGQSFASDVTDIQLSYADGSTVATINVNGAVRFTHQTEEAKDGRPYRVIVDVLSATHKLGANNFSSLPDCPVKSIRTSQYSVKPEAVVRVVFDMAAEQVYRVESSEQTITLYFAHKAGQAFAPWSTAGVVGARKTVSKAPAQTAGDKTEPIKVAATAPASEKSAQQLNQSIKQDRLVSLEAKPEPKAEKPGTKVSEGDSQYGPFAGVAPAEKPAPVVKPAEKKAVPAADKKPAAVASSETAPVSKPPASKPAPKPTPVTSETKGAEPVQAKPQPVAEKPVAASAENVEKTELDKRSTSRFRRAPVASKKIKGTLVAEFPKRLVIKYQAKQYRDPFATLIDESKTYDDPIERQVPNVEGLKLVGVIQAGSKDNRALFEDGEGYGYILKTGDKVQKGYVLRVEADRVYFQIFEYGWSRTVALHLES